MANEKFEAFINEMAEKAVKAMEKGELPWRKQWNGGDNSLVLPCNIISKNAYNGCNLFNLAMVAIEKGYTSKYWGTFKQFKDIGLYIRKGEKSSQIVKWIEIDPNKGKDEVDEEEKENKFMIARIYHVFNLEQTNVSEHPELMDKFSTKKITLKENERIEIAEEVIKNSKAKIREVESTSAFYSPFADEITIPRIGQFENSGAYYDTLLHELSHWTGHESRLNRLNKGGFGSESYAFEELIAESSSMIICGMIGIEHDVSNQYGYLKSWLKVLKNDSKLLYKAFKEAAKIAQFLKIEETIEKHITA